jgi:chemotaxis protein methyltransferase CheR
MSHPRYAPLEVRHLVPREPTPSALTPALPTPALIPQEMLDAAVDLLEEGQFEAAREVLERLVAAGGESLPAYLTLANLYGIIRQPARARQAYQAALVIEPLSAEAHLFFGIHLLAEADADGAAAEIGRSLFIDPDLALGHYFLGKCRERQRDAQRARLCYRNAIAAFGRLPAGRRQDFLGYYPDMPEDGAAFARAAEYALAAL